MSTCPNCATPLEPNASFCSRCGGAIAKPVDVAPAVPAGPKKTPGIAIAALILSIVPTCLTNIVGLILGIVAMSKIKARPNELKGRGVALAAVIVGAIWMALVPVMGVLAAIAIPNFIKFQGRSKQMEAKVNLRSIYTAGKAFELDNPESAASTFAEMGFAPEARRRYAYFYSEDALQPDLGGPYEIPEDFAELTGGREITTAAIGNIDTDSTLDIWVLDENGQPENLVNDLEN